MAVPRPGHARHARRFGESYAGLLRRLKRAMPGGRPAVLLHRLLFLYLLQRGGHLPGGRHSLCRLLHSANGHADWLAGLFLPPAIDPPTGLIASLLEVLDTLDWPGTNYRGGGPAFDPTLLGSLFAANLNQKQLGAYYTRDDVTTYIVDSTVLPWLLDRLAAEGMAGCVFRLLHERPERYVPQEVGPPDRGRRIRQLRHVESVHGLVTANVNLRRLVLDALEAGGPELAQLVRAAVEYVTILDPTCGSGVFLFAAWELLEELARRVVPAGVRPALAQRQSILERNLFGIDLMPEAVELCRLWMYLKLAALVEPGSPLPRLEVAVAVGNVLQPLPWPDRQRAGFDVIIGNPPYLPAEGVDYAAPGYATADCPDVYAWVMERSAALLKPGGRSGLIVPLSLGFSQRFAACRRLLFAQYDSHWFSSFGRIPDALFRCDVRIRNTIHLGRKRLGESAAGEPGCWATRLNRWFEAERPGLFPSLQYAAFDPALWQGRVPRLNTPALAAALEKRLRRTAARLGGALAPGPTRHGLYFKKTAYNWLTFCRRLPPCQDAHGRAIPHTQFDLWHFPTAELRDLAFLFLNGKWAFAWWCIVGDDFHVARWMLEGFPIDLPGMPARRRRPLLALVPKLEQAMRRAVSFKRNAGKRVGTYNLARCRAVTDHNDRLWGEYLGLLGVWDEVETLCKQVIKTKISGLVER